MTERLIWCSVWDVNAIDVMRLIDLIADLDTPSAAELRAFADRALVQVQTANLRLGIATDGGRPIGDILALVDGMGIKRDVWSMSSIDRPTGVDAWIVVVGPEQDLGREKRFLSRIGEMEKAVIAIGNGHGIAELGVRAERIFFGTSDLGGLARTIEGWQSDRDAIRGRVLSSHARPALDALAKDRSSLDDRLRALPDVTQRTDALATFEQRTSLAIDAFTTASGEVVEEIRTEVMRCFSDWIDMVTANHGERPNRDRVQESLEKWLRDRFAKSFSDRLGRRLGTHADNLPQLRAALAALAHAQVHDFSTPVVNVPEHSEPTALRWLLPLAGGGVGLWRGGWKLGLAGAALGLVIARVMRRRAKRPLRDRALRNAAANHLATHLDLIAQRAVEALRHDCEIERERLKQAIAEAEATLPERDRIHSTLEQLEKARSILVA